MKARSLWATALVFVASAGPALAGWTPLGGPEQPAVELQLDPAHPEVLYGRVITAQGIEEGLLWTSADGGLTWRSLQPGLLRPSSAFAVDPADPRVLWAWTPETQGVFQGELWRSGDGGTSWEHRFTVPLALSNPAVRQLLADPGDPHSLYRIDADFSGTRVAVSRDGGASFAFGPVIDVLFDDAFVFHPQRRELLAFSRGGLLASDDGGRSWSRRGSFRHLPLAAGALAPSRPDRLYAIPSLLRSGSAPCLAGSDDAGAHWTRLAAPRLRGRSHCEAVAVDPEDADHVWLTASVLTGASLRFVLVESTDGGLSWFPPRRLPAPYLKVEAAAGGALYAHGDADFLAAGVFRSDDGGRSWNRRDAGIATGDLRSGLVALRRGDGTTRLAALDPPRGGDFALFASDDGGRAWSRLSPSAPFGLAAPGGRVLLAVGEGEPIRTVLRSTNAGATWAAVPGGPPSPLNPAPYWMASVLEADALRPGHVATASFDPGPGIAGSVTPWVSDDRGATWRASAGGVPTACWHFASVDYCPALYAFATDPFGSPRRWLSFDVQVSFSATPQLFVSEDSGASWRAPAERPPSPLALLADPVLRGRLLAGTPQGLYESRDGGEHWHRLGQGLAAAAVVHQLLYTATTGALYAATVAQGIFRSGDGGATWSELGGEPDLEQPLLALDGDTLLAAFRGLGVWRWTP